MVVFFWVGTGSSVLFLKRMSFSAGLNLFNCVVKDHQMNWETLFKDSLADGIR